MYVHIYDWIWNKFCYRHNYKYLEIWNWNINYIIILSQEGYFLPVILLHSIYSYLSSSRMHSYLIYSSFWIVFSIPKTLIYVGVEVEELWIGRLQLMSNWNTTKRCELRPFWVAHIVYNVAKSIEINNSQLYNDFQLAVCQSKQNGSFKENLSIHAHLTGLRK